MTDFSFNLDICLFLEEAANCFVCDSERDTETVLYQEGICVLACLL